MSLPKAVLGDDFVEWRIYEIESTMRSPTFLMDDAGMACQVILEAVDENAKQFELNIRLPNNTGNYEVCFICRINDEHYIKVKNHQNPQSGKYKGCSRVYANLSAKHICRGKCYMSVKLRWFLLSEFLPAPSSTLPKQFSLLLESKEFSDLAIETEDGSRIPVHQNILAVRSPVFHAMLKSDMSESKSQCIKISDFPPETVKQMLTFIYSGQLEDVTYESAASLFKIADKCDLKDLKKLCGKYLLTHLSSSNALELLFLTHTYGEKKMEQHILRFISENRQDFTKPGVFDCFMKADQSLYVEIINTLIKNCYDNCGHKH